MEDDTFFVPAPTWRSGYGHLYGGAYTTLGGGDDSDDYIRHVRAHMDINGMVSEAETQQSGDRQQTVLYDLRTAGDYVKGHFVSSEIDVSDWFKNESVNVIEHTDRSERLRVIALQEDKEKTLKYLQVKPRRKFYYCLMIRESTSLENISKQLQKIGSESVASLEAKYRRTNKQPHKVKQKDIALFINHERVTISDALKLPDFTIVELRFANPVTWDIFYRYKLFYNKRYLLHCSSADSLTEIKRMFLELFKRTEMSEGKGEMSVESESVWFTQGDNLITEKLLRRSFMISLKPEVSDGLVVRTTGHQGTYVDDVYVHFQPPNAVCAKVIFKTDTIQTDVGTLVLSPEQPPSYVREEVAKLVGRRPQTIGISLGTVKLEGKIKMHQALSVSGCKITVKPKIKISLSVHVCPPHAQTHTFAVYPYDNVEVLKNHLCRQIDIPPHGVDLFFENKRLGEGSTFRDYRIQHGDELEARVFPRRQTMRVRMPDRKWHEVVVDDSQQVTVGQMKAFCQTLPAERPVPACDLTAMVQHRVLSDAQTLDNVMTGGTRRPPRLLLVHTENMGFTADTACKGIYIVFTGTEGSYFDKVLTMSSGKDIFQVGTVQEPVVLGMLEERRHLPLPPPVPGIRLICGQQHGNDVTDGSAASMPCSSSSVSETCQTSASELSKSKGISSQSGLTEVPESAGDPQHQTSQSQIEKTNRVGFHSGNSLSGSDVENVDEVKSTGVQKVQTEQDSAGVGNEAKPVGRRDVDDTAHVHSLQAAASKMNSTERGSSRKYQRSVLSSREEHSNNVPFTKKYHSSDSDATDGRREISQTIMIHESLSENEDGTWSVDQNMKIKARVQSYHELQLLRSKTPSSIPRSLSFVDGESLAEQQQNDLVQPHPTLEPTYRTIKKSTVQWIASNLGFEGMMIIRHLGVSDRTIDQAQTAHPSDLAERHMYCLKHWLTKSGSKASMEALKNALEFGERRDLAEELVKIDPVPTASSEGIESEDGTAEQQKGGV